MPHRSLKGYAKSGRKDFLRRATRERRCETARTKRCARVLASSSLLPPLSRSWFRERNDDEKERPGQEKRTSKKAKKKHKKKKIKMKSGMRG